MWRDIRACGITNMEISCRRRLYCTTVEFKEVSIAIYQDIALQGLLGRLIVSYGIMSEVVENFQREEIA